MVYILRNVTFGSDLLLGPNTCYNLGTDDKNHIFLNDFTASPFHATLKIEYNMAVIEDRNSEDGTWINKEKITNPTILEDGDIIIFGKNTCKYVIFDPHFLVFLSTSLSTESRFQLIETLSDLNIDYNAEYTEDCTHCVVENLSVEDLKAEPIMCFLIDKKPIIIPKYFEDLYERIQEAPLVRNFSEFINDTEDEDVLRNNLIKGLNQGLKRKHLFNDMVFIFFNQESYHSKLNNHIWNCGGGSLLYNNSEEFYRNLFGNWDGYRYVIIKNTVDCVENLKKFMSNIERNKIELYEIEEDNIYASIIKVKLVGCFTKKKQKNCTIMNGKFLVINPCAIRHRTSQSEYETQNN